MVWETYATHVKLKDMKVAIFQNNSYTLVLTIYSVFFSPHIILKGKRNAYFEYLNVGFILRTFFFLISAIYTH